MKKHANAFYGQTPESLFNSAHSLELVPLLRSTPNGLTIFAREYGIAGIHTGGEERGDFPPLSKISPPPFESAQVLK